MLAASVLVATQLAPGTAPADRYFGKLKMSALRIRYETMQLRRRYETHELLPDQTLHLLELTQDAYEQWAMLYPKDPWLASTGYAMAELYAELPGPEARNRATGLFLFVKSRYPTTSYARQSRDALHRGVAVKPQPAWALAPSPSAPSAAPSSPAPSPSSPIPSPEPSSTP